MDQMRALEGMDFRRHTVYELENLKNFLESFFWRRTLQEIRGLERIRTKLIKKIEKALMEKTHFPENSVVEVGSWRFNANSLFEMVERRIEATQRIAQKNGRRIDVNAEIANALKEILGDKAMNDFLEWRKKNPKKAFHQWIRKNIVKKTT